MRNITRLLLVLLVGLELAACSCQDMQSGVPATPALPSETSPSVVVPTPLPTSTLELTQSPTTVPTPLPTLVSGTLDRDDTWSGDIVVALPSLTIPEGVTLRIEPGTTVRFEPSEWGIGAGLMVYGELIAVGTPEQPIRFTSAASQPEHGDLGAINFYLGSAGSVLDHVIVEYASNAAFVQDDVVISNSIIRWTTGAALALYSTCTITNNRIYQSGSSTIEVHFDTQPEIAYNTLWGAATVSGIRVEAYAHPHIHHNIIRDNVEFGIDITWNSSARVEHNAITGNGIGIDIGQQGSAADSIIHYNNIFDNRVANLSVDVPETLNATDNWWGTADEAQIEAQMVVGTGATVVYRPFATSEVDIGTIAYDFENNETYDHLPKTEYDTFEYVFWDDDDTRAVASSITPPGTPDGIAWDGEFLYVAIADNPTDTIYKMDLLGNIVDSFPSPAIQTMGLAFDGRDLWVLDYVQRLVFQMSRSGETIGSAPAPCDEPQGLTYDGQYLWTFTNQVHGELYQFDTSGNVIRTMQTNGHNGLAWDGEYLWMNGVPGELAQIDPSNGHVIRAITSSGIATQYLVWQESYLWTVEWADEIPGHTRLVQLWSSPERVTLDGLRDDWSEEIPVLEDPQGDMEEGTTDIKALHGFTHEGYLYLMLDFYELANYHHFDVQIDMDGDGRQEYDISGFFPGDPGRAVYLEDHVQEESRSIEYMVHYHGSEVGSNILEVFELRFPLRFLQDSTAFYVRVLVPDQADGTFYLVDATDWGYVDED